VTVTSAEARVKDPESRSAAREQESEPVISVSSRSKIARLLRKVEEQLEEETSRASLGDFIRLVQLERELADEELPKEIRVTWVETPTASESGK